MNTIKAVTEKFTTDADLLKFVNEELLSEGVETDTFWNTLTGAWITRLAR